MFSRDDVEGVKEFMNFVSKRFNYDDLLYPRHQCLNHVRKPKGQVEDHLYIHGMAATYTRWVYHGEPLVVVPHEIDHHIDEHSLNDDFDMDVADENDLDDAICGLVEELYIAEEEGKRKESMFAILLEEMKQELYPSGPCKMFYFVVGYIITSDFTEFLMLHSQYF
jgi:hypothetical protein